MVGLSIRPWHYVLLGQPAAQINIGAALRAERAGGRRRRFSADRATLGHGNHMTSVWQVGVGSEGSLCKIGARAQSRSNSASAA